MADHLYIHLVVYDACGIDELIEAAHELRRRALCTRDVRIARFGITAEKCILAVAEAYGTWQALSLERPAELMHTLPELCAELCACLETERTPVATSWCEEWLPALQALSADGLIDAEEAGVPEGDCAVRFSLLPDAARPFVVCTEAAPSVQNATFSGYLREAALSLEHWAEGARRAVARLAPTSP